MKHIIEVNGITCYAYHGCLPQEAQIGGDYRVDVRIECDFSTALQTDQLNDTISYSDIYSIVRDEMKVRSKLIEHVAGRIYQRITLKWQNILKLSVKITKMNPPINGEVDNCAVVIEDDLIKNE